MNFRHIAMITVQIAVYIFLCAEAQARRKKMYSHRKSLNDDYCQTIEVVCRIANGCLFRSEFLSFSLFRPFILTHRSLELLAEPIF